MTKVRYQQLTSVADIMFLIFTDIGVHACGSSLHVEIDSGSYDGTMDMVQQCGDGSDSSLVMSPSGHTACPGTALNHDHGSIIL